jgi:hypothetical protein
MPSTSIYTYLRTLVIFRGIEVMKISLVNFVTCPMSREVTLISWLTYHKRCVRYLSQAMCSIPITSDVFDTYHKRCVRYLSQAMCSIPITSDVFDTYHKRCVRYLPQAMCSIPTTSDVFEAKPEHLFINVTMTEIVLIMGTGRMVTFGSAVTRDSYWPHSLHYNPARDNSYVNTPRHLNVR